MRYLALTYGMSPVREQAVPTPSPRNPAALATAGRNNLIKIACNSIAASVMIGTNGTHIISFIKTSLILNWDSAGNYSCFKNHIHE